MQQSWLESRAVAYLFALVIVLLFTIAAVAAIVLREGNLSAASPAITTVIGLSAPTIATLLLLLRQQHNIEQVQTVQAAVTNHIDQHTDALPPAPPAA